MKNPQFYWGVSFVNKVLVIHIYYNMRFASNTQEGLEILCAITVKRAPFPPILADIRRVGACSVFVMTVKGIFT